MSDVCLGSRYAVSIAVISSAMIFFDRLQERFLYKTSMPCSIAVLYTLCF